MAGWLIYHAERVEKGWVVIASVIASVGFSLHSQQHTLYAPPPSSSPSSQRCSETSTPRQPCWKRSSGYPASDPLRGG
eukprot:1184349-Rhodomonas_salina.4